MATLINMAQKTMNTEMCWMKSPITRLGYGDHYERGFVETDELKVGDRDVRRSNYTDATYEIGLLEIEQGGDEKPTTASIKITRTSPEGKIETQAATLIDRSTPPITYSDVIEEYQDGRETCAARVAGHSPTRPQRVAVLPFEGNGPYAVVAYASISAPGSVGKLFGKEKSAKIHISEGKLEAPLNYASME